MPTTPRLPRSMLRLSLCALAAAAALTGCGGGGSPQELDSAAIAEREGALKKGADCVGSCTGGGGTPVVGAVNPLPKVAPEPDVLVRESFGPGPQTLRPKGGKGDMRSSFVHTTIGGFWVEWPGNKNSAWITSSGDQSWKFCGTAPTPYEMPSPLEVDGNGGCAYSELFDLTLAQAIRPTALLPFTPPEGRVIRISMEALPLYLGGTYVALGLSNSSLTASNLETSAPVWLVLAREQTTSVYFRAELRLNGRAGPLLAALEVADDTFNRMELTIDPVTKRVNAQVNGQSLGTFEVPLPATRYVGFEGLGMADNFVIRALPLGTAL